MVTAGKIKCTQIESDLVDLLLVSFGNVLGFIIQLIFLLERVRSLNEVPVEVYFSAASNLLRLCIVVYQGELHSYFGEQYTLCVLMLLTFYLCCCTVFNLYQQLRLLLPIVEGRSKDFSRDEIVASVGSSRYLQVKLC
jgi:hypothetical protein